MRRRRRFSLARRYGRASMGEVGSALTEFRKIARENAPVTAAALGAGAGALAGGMGAGTGAIMGSVIGVAAQQLMGSK